MLTRKDPDKDPDDARRVDELERGFQTKSLKRFTSTPSVKQLADNEMAVIDDGSTVSSIIRRGSDLYKIDLTKIT